MGLLGPSPLVVLFQHRGKFDVHEFRAARKPATGGDLHAAFRQVESRRIDANPNALTLTAEVLDEFLHRCSLIGGFYGLRERGAESWPVIRQYNQYFPFLTTTQVLSHLRSLLLWLRKFDFKLYGVFVE